MVAGVCSCALCAHARATRPRETRAHGDEVAGGQRGLFGVLSSDVTYRKKMLCACACRSWWVTVVGTLGFRRHWRSVVGILRPSERGCVHVCCCGHRSAEAPAPRVAIPGTQSPAEKVQHPSTTSRSPARAAAAGCLPTPVGARSTPTLQPGTQPAVCVRYAASHARLLQLESAAKHGGGCQSAQSALHRAVLARREAAACRGRAPQLMRWLAGT